MYCLEGKWGKVALENKGEVVSPISEPARSYVVLLH